MICKTKKEYRVRRHLRLRKTLSGTAERPRMAVNISLNHIYVQFIDDVAGHTLASMSTLDKDFKAQNVKPNVAGAEMIGRIASERAKLAGITQVVFDRGGFRYHGRVKTLADAARAAGLQL